MPVLNNVRLRSHRFSFVRVPITSVHCRIRHNWALQACADAGPQVALAQCVMPRRNGPFKPTPNRRISFACSVKSWGGAVWPVNGS